MATVHVVSLFLPNTISFAEAPAEDGRLSPPSVVHKRVRSAVELQSRTAASVGLFTPPLNADSVNAQRKYLTPGPHAIARSEALVPEWGKRIFNQPLSRAEPPPSALIQDFAAAYEERKHKRLGFQRDDVPTPPASSRALSPDGGYAAKAWTVEPAVHGNGGLFNAIHQAEQQAKDLSFTWMGTLGFPTDALNDSLKHEIADKLLNQYHSEVVYCSDKDLDGHYVQFCKTILWPIFHYQVPDNIKSKAYADHSWEFYHNVNQAFAEKAVASYKRGDTIWVHDYHLLLVPLMIRQKLPDAKIGFFLHLAFPSSDLFRCLAKRTQLLEGVLGANLVVFQTSEYSEHFLQTCSRLLIVETTSEGVQLDDRFVNVTSHAIGIDPPLFKVARQDDEVKTSMNAILKRFEGKRIILARDKLDYASGVRHKLLAFERFLSKYSEWREKVVMIQITTSSSDQSDALAVISSIAAKIESDFATLAHQPLMFVQQDITFSEYIALLTLADVLMVTPLRDGMNLTAHDYILLQDGMDSGQRHGPLILSEFTGCATVFGDYPLRINPWSSKMQADAIHQALQMTEEEKKARWTGLHDIVVQNSGVNWYWDIDLALNRAYDDQHQRAHASVPRLAFSPLSSKYKDSKCRLFMIDYEGTLTPHKTSSSGPLGLPARVMDTLFDLLMDPNNIVYVMSGRKPEELVSHFRTLPSLGLIAENGCFVREFGVQNQEWTPLVDLAEVQKWKSEINSTLEYWRERIEGSVIEERYCSLLLRYDKSQDQDNATRQAGECLEQINGAGKFMRLRAVPIAKAILIEQEGSSKSTAAAHIFEELARSSCGLLRPDFIMVAGDDREDEVVFRWANDLGKDGVVQDVFTVTVANRNTEAQASLTQGCTGLLTVLQNLANISTELMPRDSYFNIPVIQRTKTFPA